jgi:hypothetical protein
MVAHEESYEDVGQVATYIQDMHALWENERANIRTSVAEDGAGFVVELDFPVASALMWDYVTKPEFQAILTMSNSAEVENRSNGRIGLGSTYYCAHGNIMSPHTIVDWQPLKEYTYATDPFLGTHAFYTLRLIPQGDSTTVRVLAGRYTGGSGILLKLRKLMDRYVGAWGQGKGLQKLRDRIEKEIAEGALQQPEVPPVPVEEIDRSVAESLAVE